MVSLCHLSALWLYCYAACKHFGDLVISDRKLMMACPNAMGLSLKKPVIR